MSEKKPVNETEEISLEEKLLCLIEKNSRYIFLVGITIAAILIRKGGMGFESADYLSFLVPWYDEIKSRGGISGLGTLVGSYDVPYQILIAIMTYLPLERLTAYKVFSIFFDFMLAVGAGLFVHFISLQKKNAQGLEVKHNFWQTVTDYAFLLPYGAVLITPTVVQNSSVWAQCDSIYGAFAMFAVYYLYREKHITAFIFFGVSLTFKLQAVFLLPIFLIVYFREKKFSIWNFAIIPAVKLVLGAIALIEGVTWKDFWSVNSVLAESDSYMYLNYPSFWAMVGGNYEFMSGMAIWLTLGILACGLCFVLVKKIPLDKIENYLPLTVWTVWTCLIFLPGMHERYGYVLEMLLLVEIFIDYFTGRKDELKSAVVFFAGKQIIANACYGRYLYGNYMDFNLLAIANTLLYLYYGIRLFACQFVTKEKA